MSATLLPNGKQQFIDINGKPLVAGKVFMYVPNTLIAKTTWQNAGGFAACDQGDRRGSPVRVTNGTHAYWPLQWPRLLLATSCRMSGQCAGLQHSMSAVRPGLARRACCEERSGLGSAFYLYLVPAAIVSSLSALFVKASPLVSVQMTERVCLAVEWSRADSG